MWRPVRAARVLSLLSPLYPAVAFAGPVTPTAVTFTFNQIALDSGADHSTLLTSTSSNKTFSRADGDFDGTTLSNVEVPYGRYTGVHVCFQAATQILLDGATYQGYPSSAPGGLAHGTPLFTTAAGVTSAAPSAAAPYTFVPEGGDAQWCTGETFPVALCVIADASDAASECHAGDEIYTAAGKVVPVGDGGGTQVDATLTLELYVLADLYNSVEIDPGSLAILWGPSVHITVGKPGAAMHLTATDGVRNTADVGFVFGPDKSLLWADYAKTDESAYPGMCSGQASAMLTAEPPSSSFQLPNVYPMGQFLPEESGGEVIAPVIGGACMNTMDPTQCLVVGDNRATNLLQEVGQTADISCIPDSEGPFEAMGYQYRTAASSGGDGSSVALTISRIVDPGNILGTCTSNFVGGHAGTCAKSDNSADGYPE